MYPIYPAPVRDAVTGELNPALVGEQVQVVTRGTTTPYPIYDAAEDAIPSSLVTVSTAFTTPTFYIDTETPADVYLDWYHAGSGAQGSVEFEAVLRAIAAEAQGAVQSVNGVGPDEDGNVNVSGGGGVTDHGALSGLQDDDHLQYHTDARGDARYYTKEATGSLVANSVDAARPSLLDRGNHTGFQSIASVTNLESRLAALEAGGGVGGGIPLVPMGEDVPLGTPPGLVGFIPSGVGPTPTLVETVSYDSEGNTVTCAIPSGVAVGDAVVFVAGFDPAGAGGDISVSDAGWAEFIDYSANHTRDVAMYVYRVTDATALANLGSAVTAAYTGSGRRMGVCFVDDGALVASAWPAYTSGSNRSAATINSNTTTGCQFQGFSTATVPFHRVCLAVMHDAVGSAAESSGFTLVGMASGSAGGAEPRTLSVLIKDLASTPIPAATVTHATAASSTHGGGQFIIPAA